MDESTSPSELHSPQHICRESKKLPGNLHQLINNAVKIYKKFGKFIFPVELLFLLYIFNLLFRMTYYQQYYFQRLAHDELASVQNYTAPPHSICLNQQNIVHYIGNKSFLHLQERVNDLSMYTNVIDVACVLISSILLGPLSDLVGRKPVFLYMMVGTTCSFILQSLIVYYNWNIYYYFIVGIIFGMSGGFSLSIGLSSAYVTDTTPKKWLGIRLSVLEATIAIARAGSSLGSNNWIHSNGCNFFPLSLLMVSTAGIAILYLLFMPESLTRKARDKRSSTNTRGFSKFMNGLKIFFYPKYIGFSNWWRVWVATGVICIGIFSAVGGVEIKNFFLHNRPLEWSYDHIGYYSAAWSGLMGLVLLFLLPVFVAVGLSNAFISLIGSVCAISANVIIANTKTSWEIYIAGVLQSMQQLGFPAMRTVLASLVHPEDHGAVFTISSSFQMIASIISTIVFNKVYKPETVVDGHKINAGIAFWVMAAIWTTSIPLLLLLMFCKRRKKFVDSEKRELLYDNVNSSYGSNNNK